MIDISDWYELGFLTDDVLVHYGTPRHSGRYPWGSGENPYQHQDDRSIYRKNKNFLERVNQMRKDGMADKDIAPQVGAKNSTDLRAKVSAAKHTNQKIDMAAIDKLREKGLSTKEIALRLDIPRSTITSLENPKTRENTNSYSDIENQLKNELKTKKYIDVGTGSEAMLGDGGISADKLKKVLKNLEAEGYTVCEIKTEQMTNPGQMTTLKVLAPPGTTRNEVSRNRIDIQTISDPDHTDKKVTVFGIEKPVSIDSSRIYIRYDDDPISGGLKDGVIELRRGVKDLNLGENTVYSQVRVGVDDHLYLKGMAVYSDDVPDGYDLIFNTTKKRGTPLEKVLKPMKKINENDPDSPIDWDNPFGSTIKDGPEGQYHYEDSDGTVKLGAINKVNNQGDWDNWARELSSQWLSKQPMKIIQKQLDITYANKEAQLDQINSIQNPIIKKYLLEEFGRDCDSSSVYLKAAGFPRQGQKVILPCNSLGEGEIYCPSMNDGEYVIGIRHPFQGLWESPLLRVNNRNEEAKRVYGNSQDVAAIRSQTANQMSGADFDGDTITVIPIKGMEKDIAYSPTDDKLPQAILDLRTFDPKKAYARKPGDTEVTGKETKNKFSKEMEMGLISNLITDMTLMDAPYTDLAKATKHALVVIDALKHNLDWKQSMIDNDIEELRLRYQGKKKGGASTLISRAKGVFYVPERNQFRADIDEEGRIIPYYTDAVAVGKDGKEHPKKQKSTKMAEHEDAYELMSDPQAGFPQEKAYADYANKMKALGNTARKNSLDLKGEYNSEAAKVYAKEVSSLNVKLNNAIKNKPYERIAQIQARAVYREKVKGIDQKLDNSEKKKKAGKMAQQSINAARRMYGSSREYIEFTPREWEAMMAGALKPSTVDMILKNSKTQTITSMAIPHEKKQLTPAMTNRIQSMARAGYTLADIAEAIGTSTSTVDSIIRGK